jgi:DNA polymerase-3 subunit gamma/tau
LFRRKEEKKEEKVEPSAPKKENAFTQEDLESLWKKFGDSRLSNGAGDAEKLVLGRDLSKLEGNEISILLGSQLEINILEKFEQDLIQYLRKELENDLILLGKSVKEQMEGQKLYTSQDKYDFMVKENPSLKKLKEKLGLDFEY